MARQARRTGHRGCRTRGSRSPPTRSSGSPRPASAGPTFTCTRCSARSSTPVTCSATSRWGWSRRSAAEVDQIALGRPRRDPVQHLVRPLLHVRPRPPVAVRDDPEPRPGHRGVAARLHEALRPGARRPGRVPARAAGALRPDQGPRGPARRPLRLPLGRAADRLAGGRVRRHPGRRQRRRVRPRADRRDVDAGGPAPRRRPGHRPRPRSGADRARPSPRRRDARRHRGRRRRGGDPRDDERPRDRQRDRRRRDGGARRSRRASSHRRWSGCSPTPSPRS